MPFDQQGVRPVRGSGFLAGFLNALPLQIATIPFGVIFGALAMDAGLSLLQTMAMTTVVVAGAAQLVALHMMTDAAPTWLIVLTAGFVNLRMAIYSAGLAMHWQGVGPWPRVLAAWFLNDQSYALSMRRYDTREESREARVAFFFGVGTCCLGCWISACLAGAIVGTQIPASWPVDFAVPVVFIALVAPWLRNWPNIASAVVAGGLSVLLAGWANGAGVIVALVAGIAVGMIAGSGKE
ncbi:AzlC family ABC transporter permease [Rhodobacteraceae bacterium NNCM2]|nr:AzlC family ABC transporter permease [Coraliihabitans acroporae]